MSHTCRKKKETNANLHDRNQQETKIKLKRRLEKFAKEEKAVKKRSRHQGRIIFMNERCHSRKVNRLPHLSLAFEGKFPEEFHYMWC